MWGLKTKRNLKRSVGGFLLFVGTDPWPRPRRRHRGAPVSEPSTRRHLSVYTVLLYGRQPPGEHEGQTTRRQRGQPPGAHGGGKRLGTRQVDLRRGHGRRRETRHRRQTCHLGRVHSVQSRVSSRVGDIHSPSRTPAEEVHDAPPRDCRWFR